MKNYKATLQIADAGNQPGYYLKVSDNKISKTVVVNDWAEISGLGWFVALDLDEDGRLVGVEVV